MYLAKSCESLAFFDQIRSHLDNEVSIDGWPILLVKAE